MGRYNPEDAAGKCWPEGEYDATISDVVEMESKSGKPMDKVTFEMYRGGESKLHTEYFVLEGAATWRYKVLAAALGQKEAFNDGTFAAKTYTGRRVRVELTIEESDQYGDQNRIGKILKPTEAGGESRPAKAAAPATGAAEGKVDPDDIPF